MSDIRIKTCVLGQVSTNCYLVYDENTKEGVVIDPADNAPYILNKCSELGINLTAVLLTHGHFDHIMAVPDVVRAFRVKVYAYETEDNMLADTKLNMTGGFRGPQTSLHADVLLHDGQELELLGTSWKVLFTPGHTAGSCCFYLPEEGIIFAGDTLVRGSYGRTDLPTGNTIRIVSSIVDILFNLPDDTMVYTGHGDPTTIGFEKQGNPVFAVRDNILRVKGPDAFKQE